MYYFEQCDCLCVPFLNGVAALVSEESGNLLYISHSVAALILFFLHCDYLLYVPLEDYYLLDVTVLY
jgi:hypothetical protein